MDMRETPTFHNSTDKLSSHFNTRLEVQSEHVMNAMTMGPNATNGPTFLSHFSVSILFQSQMEPQANVGNIKMDCF